MENIKNIRAILNVYAPFRNHVLKYRKNYQSMMIKYHAIPMGAGNKKQIRNELTLIREQLKESEEILQEYSFMEEDYIVLCN